MTNSLEGGSANDARSQFSIYESLVKQYSPRVLTFPSDSLAAFTGILSVMETSFCWKFASALPEHAFDLALLWRPMFGAKMRPRLCSAQQAGPLACRSPTWCWTAWHGDIYWNSWRLDSFAAQKVTLKTEVVEFWIQKFGRLHPIKQRRANGSVLEIPAYGLSEQVPTDCVLVFKAKAIDLNLYTVSPPRMDQCVSWNS